LYAPLASLPVALPPLTVKPAVLLNTRPLLLALTFGRMVRLTVWVLPLVIVATAGQVTVNVLSLPVGLAYDMPPPPGVLVMPGSVALTEQLVYSVQGPP
jgi:hypothetical protein